MTTINATWFKDLMNDSDITDQDAEVVVQNAIDCLNTFGAGISDLSGSAGSKTLSATSAEAGAISLVGKQVYAKMYKNADGANVSLGTVSVSYSSDNQLLSFARQLAFQLRSRSFERI